MLNDSCVLRASVSSTIRATGTAKYDPTRMSGSSLDNPYFGLILIRILSRDDFRCGYLDLHRTACWCDCGLLTMPSKDFQPDLHQIVGTHFIVRQEEGEDHCKASVAFGGNPDGTKSCHS